MRWSPGKGTKSRKKIHNSNLFRESLLPAGDDEEVVEEDEVHLGGLARIEEDERTLLENLPPGTDDESFARLPREGGLEELGEELLGVHLEDGRPHDVALDLQEAVEVLQPLHLVVKLA